MTSELFRQIQEGMGYSDEEFRTVMSDPRRKKILEAGPTMVRRKIIAEITDAKNCAAHKTGAKYIIRGNGVLLARECSDNMCIGLLAVLSPVCQVVFERLAEGEDPGAEFISYVHCPDTGVNCGGFGEVVAKVTVE